jgi:hypothetical protein
MTRSTRSTIAVRSAAAAVHGAGRFAPRSAAIAVALLAATACTTTYDFDPVTVGDEEHDREPRAKSSSQFIRSVYADVLGRTPEVFDFTVAYQGVPQYTFQLDEQSQLIGAQDAIGDPTPIRSRLVAAILRSPEAAVPAKADVDDPAAYIADQFRTLLGREPSPYELARFSREWNDDPAVGPRAVIRALIGSREYQSQ